MQKGFFHDLFDIRLIWLTGLFDLLGGGLPVRNALLYTIIAEVVEPGVLYDRHVPEAHSTSSN